MKKVIWILVALLVGGYFVNSYMEKKAKREVERAEANRIDQATRTAVSQMVPRTDAIDDWVTHLSGREISLRANPRGRARKALGAASANSFCRGYQGYRHARPITVYGFTGERAFQ